MAILAKEKNMIAMNCTFLNFSWVTETFSNLPSLKAGKFLSLLVISLLPTYETIENSLNAQNHLHRVLCVHVFCFSVFLYFPLYK